MSALAACLCLAAVGLLSLLQDSDPKLQSWHKGYTGQDYFRYCETASGGQSAAAVIDESALPFDESRSFSDQRSELEAAGVIPEIATHPLFSFTANYQDGSLYSLELTWSRRSADGLDDYSDLKVVAGFEEVPDLTDCVSVEVDENGHLLEPAVTVTERDGVQIVARGGEHSEKSLTFRNENGWYKFSGSWNDDYDAVAELLDWFWEHPLDFTQYPVDAGDSYTYTTLAEMPDAFRGYLPDFAAFGFIEESTYVALKNGVPARFEGHYVAHADEQKVQAQDYYDTEGYTLMHWCVLGEPDVYDLEGCLGDIGSLTADLVADTLAGQNNKLKFRQDDLLIIVYPDRGDEAWALIESLQQAR